MKIFLCANDPNAIEKCLISVRDEQARPASLPNHWAGSQRNQKKYVEKISIPLFFSDWFCVYGRLRCGMATKDVPPGKPRRYLWPELAVNIAQKKQHPVRLCEDLIALTGYDKAACWRFLKKHGVERPGSGSDGRSIRLLLNRSLNMYQSTVSGPRPNASTVKPSRCIT